MATVTARIADFTASLRPQIADFLTNPRLELWHPPSSVDDETRRFYHDLAIPRLNEKPSLLLHKLGFDPNPSIGQLFQGLDHR